ARSHSTWYKHQRHFGHPINLSSDRPDRSACPIPLSSSWGLPVSCAAASVSCRHLPLPPLGHLQQGLSTTRGSPRFPVSLESSHDRTSPCTCRSRRELLAALAEALPPFHA